MLIQYSYRYMLNRTRYFFETKLLHLEYAWAVVWPKVVGIGEAPCFISKRQYAIDVCVLVFQL